MKSTQSIFLSILALISAYADATTPLLQPRSQSLNNARQMVGWNNTMWGIHRPEQTERFGSMNIAFAYNQTFRNDRIAYCLFGDDLDCSDCGPSITIQGSAVANRSSKAWLADYFGLPRDFQSTVSFNPRIQNFLVDFSFYAGLDEWVSGLYVKAYAPFVHTRWRLNATEAISETGSLAYFQGYFDSSTALVNPPINNVELSDLNTSFLAYASGATPSIDGITWDSLCCSRIHDDCDCDGESSTRNGFGEVRATVGYNVINDEENHKHLGVGLYIAAPTGTRPGRGKYGRDLFQPIVGNGKHWELGGEIVGHCMWWRSEDENRSFGMYLQATVTHLFKARQTRCFDLCGKPNSRYMLAQKFTQFNSENDNQFDSVLDQSVAPDKLQFGNHYSPVANLTERSVKSSFAIQGDVALSLAYQSGGFQWDLGYNFWGRSCEKIELDDTCCQYADLRYWALKGDQRVYGFEDSGTSHVALAASDSNADIHSGSNMKHCINYATEYPSTATNRYADNPMLAVSQGEGPDPVYIDSNATAQIHTSVRPITLSQQEIDMNGTRAISHKLFTHFNYAWTENQDSNYTPYVGVGAEVEFGKTEGKCSSDCKTECETNACPVTTTVDCDSCATVCSTCPSVPACCQDCAISQWGVWLKVGASYN